MSGGSWSHPHHSRSWRYELLYRPTKALIVVDDVRSAEPHEYVRRFHFGSAMETKESEPGRIAVSGKKLAAILTDWRNGTQTTLTRGSDVPRLAWTYPGDRDRAAIWTASLCSRASNATFASALALDGIPLTIAHVTGEAERLKIEFAEGSSLEMRSSRHSASVHSDHR